MGSFVRISICTSMLFIASLRAQDSSRAGSTAQSCGRGAAATGVQQQLFLSAGWNIVSSYVYPADPFLTEMLAGIEEHLLILKDGRGRVFWPAYGINKIVFWEKEKGYQLYVTEAETLIVDGKQLVPEEVSIDLAEGWNMISYVRSSPLAPAAALASITDYLFIVKDSEGRIYWPSQNIDQIGEMEPGKGYYCYLSQPAVLIYPPNGAESGRISTPCSRQFPAPLHFHPFRTNTGSSAILLLKTPELLDGDEIAACTADGKITGSGVVQEGEALLVLWGDDEVTPLVDGARNDEPLHLLCWFSRTGSELPVQCTSLRDALESKWSLVALRFHDNAVLTGETLASARLPERAALAQNYPNPFNSSTLLLYQLPENGEIELAVYDLCGRRVRSLAAGMKAAGWYEVVWDGRSDAGTPLSSGFYWVVMRTGGLRQQIKMTLIK